MSNSRTMESYTAARLPRTVTPEPAPRVRYIVAVLVALVAAVIVLAPFAPAPAHAAGFPACQYEDGSGQAACVWDARHMGNGTGQSYIIRNGGKWDTAVTYISHRRAHRLLGL